MEGILWEREEEQASMRPWTGRRGTGGRPCSSGEPGVGKTALLALATADGRFAVVRAGGHEMEQAYAFPLMQQVMASLPRACNAAPEELTSLVCVDLRSVGE